MVLKPSKKPCKSILLALTVVILSVLTTSRQEITIALHNASEWVASQDLGFSTLGNIADTGDGDFSSGGYTQPISEKLASLVKKIPDVIKYKTNNRLDKNFERLDIDVKFQDYKIILNDRETAINSGQLFDPKTVKANIRFKNKTFKTRIRLKGDLQGHWLSERRMSFRVKVKKGSILGFREFSIQKPRERQFPYDYTYQRLSKEVGNLSSAQNFVHLFVNGSDWGIMNIEEHFTKEFLEKQQRKESLIVRFSKEEETWANNHVEEPYFLHREYDSSLYTKPYKSSKYLQDQRYREVFSYISDNHLNFNPKLYDSDSMTKAYALALSWGHMHALRDNNAKYYFNPYTLKLEPIATDQYRYHIVENIKNIENWPPPPQFYSASLNSEYRDNLYKNLEEVGSQIGNLEKYFNDSAKIFPIDAKKNANIVHRNYKQLLTNADSHLSFEKRGTLSAPFLLYVDNKQLNNPIPSNTQAERFKNHVHFRHYTDGTIEIYNLIPDHVTIENITFKGESIIDQPIDIPGYLDKKSPYIIKSDIVDTQDGKILVHTQYKNFARITDNGISLIKNTHNPLLKTTKKSNFLVKIKEGTYKIKNGSWEILEPTVINGDLHIEENTKLKFDSNAYLIVKGAINAIGGEKDSIVLDAKDNTWKGLYVLNANNKSNLKNVLIANTSALSDGMLGLTGGVTFYNSDVNIDSTNFLNSSAEDALNIVKSNFSIKNTKIQNSRSDSLDSDFSTGMISNSEVLGSDGDALDFSGSTVGIHKTKISNIKDKAISAGEASNITAEQVEISNVGVGIASKDGSKTTANNCSVKNYKLYAVMTYTKKDFYGNPSLSIENCDIEGGMPFFSQNGSTLMFNKEIIASHYLDVKNLYKGSVMKK